jgi:hypothetical protein
MTPPRDFINDFINNEDKLWPPHRNPKTLKA